MSTLIWLGVLTTYVVGLFPALIKTTRATAMTPPDGEHCSRLNSARFCRRYHRRTCGTPGGDPLMEDVYRAIPIALIWPFALLALLTLMQAKKRPPIVHDLQGAIADLERELGIGGTR